MVNAWSLLYEELNGTMDETYPIKENDMSEEFDKDITISSAGINTATDSDETPFKQNFLADNDDQAAHHFGDVDPVYAHHFPGKPQPDLENGSTQKYQEDKGIADLKSYVASTYKGHYTNQGSNVQTLDLIHSVGDAESFCRSNAIKYLSRYDKKGSAKNDILKAMHYCLLLYYFSGNTNPPEYTNTRYETF
jgi:hypothetical protein